MCKDNRRVTLAIEQGYPVLLTPTCGNHGVGIRSLMTFLALSPLYKSDVPAGRPHQRIASILPLFHFFFLKLPTRSLCQGRVFLCMKGSWDD